MIKMEYVNYPNNENDKFNLNLKYLKKIEDRIELLNSYIKKGCFFDPECSFYSLMGGIKCNFKIQVLKHISSTRYNNHNKRFHIRISSDLDKQEDNHLFYFMIDLIIFSGYWAVEVLRYKHSPHIIDFQLYFNDEDCQETIFLNTFNKIQFFQRYMKIKENKSTFGSIKKESFSKDEWYALSLLFPYSDNSGFFKDAKLKYDTKLSVFLAGDIKLYPDNWKDIDDDYLVGYLNKVYSKDIVLTSNE